MRCSVCQAWGLRCAMTPVLRLLCGAQFVSFTAWKALGQMPKVVGVVAALGFTEEQLGAAAEKEIKCVYLSGNAFTMV